MRELEFLPSWYHQTRRRKRIVAIEGYIVAALILTLGGWIAFSQRSVRTREVTLGALQQQLDSVYSKEQLLNKQLALRQQLSEREELIASLGYPVDMTRLLHTLDSVMPKEMTILELDCQTREVARPVSTVAAIFKSSEKKPVDRKLDIKLCGVTPDDSDIGNLLSELQKRPFFEQLNVTKIQNRTDDAHRMREFEVTFSMNLNQQAEKVAKGMLSLQKKIFWLGRVQWTLAVVMILLVSAFVIFGYRPQTRRIAELDAKILSCQREMLLHQGQTSILSGVQADVERLTARLQEFKRLPQQHELGEVIKDVAQVAQQSLRKTPDIRMGTQVQRGERLVEAPIQLTFEGDFVSVFSFLKHAEELPRLTRMPSINIKSKDKQGQVKVQMTMNLYCAAE